MFDSLQEILIGSTFRERRQMINQAKDNKILQEQLKSNFIDLELAKLAAKDPKFTGGFDSVQEFKKYITKWEIIKYFSEVKYLYKTLNLCVPNNLETIGGTSLLRDKLDISHFSFETKKIIYGILNRGVIYKWAKKKKIISDIYKFNSPVDRDYEEIISYQTLNDLNKPTNTENIENLVKEVSDLNANFDKQQKTLEKIESLLERFLSKVEIMNKLDKAQDPEL